MTAPAIVGPIEIAQRLGVRRQTVRMWRSRGTLPDPLVVISGVPIWWWPDIRRWAMETGRYEG